MLREILRPIGLYNVRAKRLVEFARVWNQAPPGKGRVYRPRGKGYGRGAGGKGGDEGEEGWEIAHLPGVGPYALDSWRMFGRDALVGKYSEHSIPAFHPNDSENDNEGSKRAEKPEEREEEWKRVIPGDKDLRAWMIWRWKKEGFEYDVLAGRRKRQMTILGQEKVVEEEEEEEEEKEIAK